MSPDQRTKASELWLDGASARDIATIVGSTEWKILRLAKGDRRQFPRRTIRRGNRWFTDYRDVPVIEVVGEPLREGTMLWTTAAGAQVTLPLISFIEWPHSIQREAV